MPAPAPRSIHLQQNIRVITGQQVTFSNSGPQLKITAPGYGVQTAWLNGQRATVDGVECDVVCTGRFYDFFEKRSDKWGLVLRQPIYERDRIDPVDPAAGLGLDMALLASFPIGYRHLAYVQTHIGYTVKRDMPGLTGPEVEALYTRGTHWLAGTSRDVE